LVPVHQGGGRKQIFGTTNKTTHKKTAALHVPSGTFAIGTLAGGISWPAKQ
jgi:hypothetical protein